MPDAATSGAATDLLDEVFEAGDRVARESVGFAW